QRVRLAQALAHRPRVVLLDEPMTGLDPVARRELGATIAGLPGRGVGVVVSSHVLHELESVAERVVFVHQGRVLADGRVADLREELPGQPRRYRIVAGEARAFAGRLLAVEQVGGVAVIADSALEVTVRETSGFAAALTELAAAWSPGVSEIEPLDEDLGYVFGRLVS
ncbi:MAG: hypothetical protein KDE27_17540, partial [Planctomycetes bacterium]|nr:hypothetical protein [Planctomycetota bacterium]